MNQLKYPAASCYEYHYFAIQLPTLYLSGSKLAHLVGYILYYWNPFMYWPPNSLWQQVWCVMGHILSEWKPLSQLLLPVHGFSQSIISPNRLPTNTTVGIPWFPKAMKTTFEHFVSISCHMIVSNSVCHSLKRLNRSCQVHKVIAITVTNNWVSHS